MKILLLLQEKLELTEYQIEVLRYFFIATLSEISKFFILGILFFIYGYFFEYITIFIILMFLRPCTGGLHFKKYYQCFFFTTLFFVMSIIILPRIILPYVISMIFLLICVIITYHIGPITSIYRQKPEGVTLKKNKSFATSFIFLYFILMFIIPDNYYLHVGFWGIIMQTIQLLVSYYLQKRRWKS